MTNAIKKLSDMLTAANIPYELTTDAEGNSDNQLWYPNYENRVMDAICNKYSYGGDEGLIEIMGLLTEEEAEHDDVVGYLTPEDVFKRITQDYHSNH